jgi:hypothetical protein
MANWREKTVTRFGPPISLCGATFADWRQVLFAHKIILSPRRFCLPPNDYYVQALGNRGRFLIESAKKVCRKLKGDSTMRFMMLVRSTKNYEAGMWPDAKLEAELAKYREELVKAGVRLDGARLQPSSQGVRVHYAKGKCTVLDGPFAETKELIAGYAILQFTSKAEAIEWTKRFVEVDAPGRLGGESECEIRPFLEGSDCGSQNANTK